MYKRQFQHLANQANGLQEPNKLVVSETDFGEVFYFDYAAFDKEECPIHLRLPSGSHVEYAEDFYEFLKRRIEAHVR